MFQEKNRNGQALVEFVIILHVFVVLVFAVFFFSTYMFDRLIVLYAANIAINEAMAMAPVDGTQAEDLESIMRNRAREMLGYRYSGGDFDITPNVTINNYNDNRYGNFRITVEERDARSPPFSAILDPIRYTLEVDYVF